MKNNKVSLKKLNKANSSTVRVMDCHCGCEGRVGQALNKHYLSSFV